MFGITFTIWQFNYTSSHRHVTLKLHGIIQPIFSILSLSLCLLLSFTILLIHIVFQWVHSHSIHSEWKSREWQILIDVTKSTLLIEIQLKLSLSLSSFSKQHDICIQWTNERNRTSTIQQWQRITTDEILIMTPHSTRHKYGWNRHHHHHHHRRCLFANSNYGLCFKVNLHLIFLSVWNTFCSFTRDTKLCASASK